MVGGTGDALRGWERSTRGGLGSSRDLGAHGTLKLRDWRTVMSPRVSHPTNETIADWVMDALLRCAP